MFSQKKVAKSFIFIRGIKILHLFFVNLIQFLVSFVYLARTLQIFFLSHGELYLLFGTYGLYNYSTDKCQTFRFYS